MIFMNDTSLPSVSVSARFRGETLNRIYRIWLFRKLAPVLVLEIAALSLLFYAMAQLVFVERVVDNGIGVFFRSPSGIPSFVIGAFLHAPMVTKFIVAGIVVFTALLIRLLTQGLLRFILVRENYFSRIVR